jgi:hypothetical protein
MMHQQIPGSPFNGRSRLSGHSQPPEASYSNCVTLATTRERYNHNLNATSLVVHSTPKIQHSNKGPLGHLVVSFTSYYLRGIHSYDNIN